MPELEQEFRSAEEVHAAAQAEFGVDLQNHGEVMAKARALNDAARSPQGGHDYSQVERLTHLLAMYDQMTGATEAGTFEKAA